MKPITSFLKNPLLAEVLRPRGQYVESHRPLYPAEYTPGSVQDELVEKAAHELRAIYSAGLMRVPFDAKDPGPFCEACASTCEAANEAAEVLTPSAGAIVLAIFQRCWNGCTSSARPTTRRAQVEMQLHAIDAAKRLHFMFSKQASLLA